MLTAERLVGLLAEPERRRIVAALILGAIIELDDIATTAGIDTRMRAIDALHRCVTRASSSRGAMARGS